jgi:hypothetical protein
MIDKNFWETNKPPDHSTEAVLRCTVLRVTDRLDEPSTRRRWCLNAPGRLIVVYNTGMLHGRPAVVAWPNAYRPYPVWND